MADPRQRGPDGDRVHAVSEVLLIESHIAGQFATRAKARGFPVLAADLRALRMRLEGLAEQLNAIVQYRPGRY